jgi:hypothetical protein
VRGGTEVAQLERRLCLVHQDVVRLDVGVDDVALAQKSQSHQQLSSSQNGLLCVYTNKNVEQTHFELFKNFL